MRCPCRRKEFTFLPTSVRPTILSRLCRCCWGHGLRQFCKEIAAEQSMQSRFLVAGARLFSSTPTEAAAFAAKETVMWREVVRLSGLTPQ